MSNWTPKEIDKLFQDGSKKHEFEYNDAAWDKMEILLDDRDRRRRRFLWWFFGGVLSILSIGGVYFLNYSNQEIEIDKKVETIILPETEELSTSKNAIVAPIKKNFLTKNDAKTAPKVTQVTKGQSIQKTGTSFDNTTIKINQKAKKESSSNTAERQTATTIVNPKKVLPISTAKRLASEVTLLGQSSTDLPSELKANQTLEKKVLTATLATKKRANNFLLDALPTLPSTIDFSSELILLDTIFLKKGETVLPPSKKRTNNHFVVGVLLGREISFVDMGICDPKWKTGLSLAYRFSGKHSIRIEGSYSQKEYVASGAKYIAPQGFWETGIPPQSTTGTCNILETSITESYFFKGYSAKGFYINGGLTSYFMLKEWYDYEYDSMEAGLRRAWGTKNENQHWFGIGEVSFGYNLPFSNNASLQIAPFAQIPLIGVGHGQIKLFSSGINLRYNFYLR